MSHCLPSPYVGNYGPYNFSWNADIDFSNVNLSDPTVNYMLNYDPTACKPWSLIVAGTSPDDQTLSFNCLTNELTITDGNTITLPTYCLSLVGNQLTLTQTCWGNTTDLCFVNIPDLDTQDLSFDCLTGILSLTNSPDVDLGSCFLRATNWTLQDFTNFLWATFDLDTDLSAKFPAPASSVTHFFVIIETTVNDVDIINETAAPSWIKDWDTVTFQKVNPFGFNMTHTNFPWNQPIVANVQDDTITLMRSASAGKRKLFM